MNSKDFIVLMGSVWVAPLNPGIINTVVGAITVGLFIVLSIKEN